MAERGRSSRPRWLVLLVALCVVVLVSALVMLGGRLVRTPHDDTSTGSATPSAPSGEPKVPPFQVSESAALTVPQDLRVASHDFTLEEGGTYVVTVDVATEKPADSAGVNIFLGARLECTDPSGEPMGTAGGTENLLTGEPVTLSSQLLLHPSRDGVHHCDVLLNAPSDAGASAGTRFTLDTSWSVTPVEGLAVQTPAVERLPMTIPAGAREMTFSEVVPLSELAEGHLHMNASLNLTTCTGVGGSREDGRTWCGEDDIDTRASTFEVETRMDVIGANGAVCGAIDSSRESMHLERFRHHQLLHVERYAEVPEELCGDRVRISLLVANTGPASLVVHRQNSSMITTETRVTRTRSP